jgi:hypothetical protein
MNIIFLIVWLHVLSPDGNPVPTAQFVSSFPSMKACTAVKERIQAKDADLKHRISCMSVNAIGDDTSESL